MALGPSYNLPKLKDKTLIYLSKKILSSRVRLRNGKVLGTHSTQTEFDLLDSNDHFLHDVNDMLNIHNRNLTKTNSYKFTLWMCPIF